VYRPEVAGPSASNPYGAIAKRDLIRGTTWNAAPSGETYLRSYIYHINTSASYVTGSHAMKIGEQFGRRYGVTDADRALARAPQHAAALNLRGAAYANLGRTDAAIAPPTQISLSWSCQPEIIALPPACSRKRCSSIRIPSAPGMVSHLPGPNDSACERRITA